MCVNDLEPAMGEKSLQRKISRIRAQNDDQAQKISRRSQKPPKRFQMCWGRLSLSTPGDLLILLVMLGGLLDQFGEIGEDPLEKVIILDQIDEYGDRKMDQ